MVQLTMKVMTWICISRLLLRNKLPQNLVTLDISLFTT